MGTPSSSETSETGSSQSAIKDQNALELWVKREQELIQERTARIIAAAIRSTMPVCPSAVAPPASSPAGSDSPGIEVGQKLASAYSPTAVEVPSYEPSRSGFSNQADRDSSFTELTYTETNRSRSVRSGRQHQKPKKKGRWFC